MPEPKTRPTDSGVNAFIQAIPDEKRRADVIVLDEIMRTATGEPPVLWGTSIIGYGNRPYMGSNGKTVDWPRVGFASRKAEIVLYVNTQLDPTLLEALGKHRLGVGCLYLKKLEGLDLTALRTIIELAANQDPQPTT